MYRFLAKLVNILMLRQSYAHNIYKKEIIWRKALRRIQVFKCQMENEMLPNVMNESLNSLNTSSSDITCINIPSHHILFQAANICFIISYLAPNGKYCILFMHSTLAFGFLLSSTWAWNVICTSGVFGWNFAFMIVNICQTLYLLYSMRKIKFPKELEETYETLFEPLMITRMQFKKLAAIGQVMILHAGEAYAMENLTKTDRLGLLISGKVNVISGNHYLHCIEPKQFLDSPEFESSKTGTEDKFKVSLIAATPCRYIFWQRQSLEYLLIKETYMASILSLILARDITNKLYAMNEKIVAERGSHLDIRLPIIITSLCNSASSIASNEQQMDTLSQMKPRQTPRSPVMIFKGSRSKSLQTNSLGMAIANSPRVTNRAAALKLSPKRESLDPTKISEELSIELRNMNISPSHGVKYKQAQQTNFS